MDKAAASQTDGEMTTRSGRVARKPGHFRDHALGVAQTTSQRKQRNTGQAAHADSTHDYRLLGQLAQAAEASLSDDGASSGEAVKPAVDELIAGIVQCRAGAGRQPRVVAPDAAQPQDGQQRRPRRIRAAISVNQEADLYACAEAALAYEDSSESLRQRSTRLDADMKLYAERTEALVQQRHKIDALQDVILSAAVEDKETHKHLLQALVGDAGELQLKQHEASIFCEVAEIHVHEAHCALAKARARIRELVARVSLRVRRKGVAARILPSYWTA